MRFGSVCSGIEAASVAWHAIGWQAAWLSEIEPSPCAMLAYHYPTTPNYGDMTTLPPRILAGEVEAPDVFCGGTPCQAFSVAGNRQSLDDARGNLSLMFCEIANAIDNVRHASGQPPVIIFWENVPGVLNTKDNAFGCFLAELAGESVPLQPPGGKWTDAGCVLGPQRAVAWRTLDAQHFGLAQRRKRVFVVASARNGFDPGAVLFESEGMRRDTPPSRKTGQTVAAHATGSVAVKGQRLVSFGEYVDDETAPTMKMRDYKDATDLVCYNIIADVTPKITEEIAGTLRADGGGGIVPSSVAYALQGGGATSQNGHGIGHNEEVCFTLNATDVHGVAVAGVPHAFKVRGGSPVETGEYGGTPGKVAGKGYMGMDELAYTIACAPDQHIAVPLVAHPINTLVLGGRPDPANDARMTVGIGSETDPAFTLQAAHCHAVATYSIRDDVAPKFYDDMAGTIGARDFKGPQVVATRYAVRRLTPTECERLQGFADGYTNVPTGKKGEVADGPRYKALGNSWAVPVVRWIGRRIQAAL